MLLITVVAGALAATDVVPLTQVAQVRDLCAAFREQPADTEADPVDMAEQHKAALARRDEAAARWYRVEIPSKGFAFGQYRAKDRQLELDGDRPVRAVEGALALDLDGIDDVAFNAKPEQVKAWAGEKKAGALMLVVVFKPGGDRCAGSAAAQSWRMAGKVRSWELADAGGVVASANEEGEPVGGGPRTMKVEKVALDSDNNPPDDEGRARLSSVQGALQKCAAGAQRGGNLLLSFSVQSGRVRDAQVIMDSLRDEKIAECVSRAVNGAEVGGSGRGTASITLD